MTSFLDRLLAPLGYSKAPADPVKPPAMLLAQADAQRWDPPDATQAERQARLYQNLTWISTAIDHVAALTAGGVASVKQLVDGPDGDEKDLPNHAFELLLRKPNPLQSKFEFMRDLASWQKITGNAYIFQNAEREGAPPDEFWLVPAHLMVPIPDGQSYVKGYTFTAPGKEPIFVDRWRIVHLKTFNPLNPFVGLSALQSLGMDAYGDLAQQKWNLALFDKSNGKFPGILAFKQMIADSEWKNLLKQRDEQWGGTNRASVTMLRGVGDQVQWLPAALSQKDMEFLGGREFTKQEIYDKLAPGLASILAVNATEANAIAGKATLIELAVWPMLDQLAQKWTAEVMPLYGDDLVVEFDDMRQTNRILDLQEQAEYSKYHTVNEVRMEYYGDAPLYLDPSVVKAIAEHEAEAAARLNAMPQAMQAQAGQPAPIPGKASKQVLDPRGLMFVAQIGPATATPGEKPAAPPPVIGAPAQPPMTQQPGDAGSDPAQPSDGQAQADELAKWEKWAVKRMDAHPTERGRVREFEPRALPLFRATRIKAALDKARTREQVRAVFASERGAEVSEIAKLTAAIEAATLLLQE